MPNATLKQVAEFFGYTKLSDFRTDWLALSEEEQNQLKSGIGDGTFTY